MFADLETLMLQEGWEKLSRNTIGSFTTSRGYKYTAAGEIETYPGKYPETTAIKMYPGSTFTHSSVAAAASETFYNDYPMDFSISFWLNLSEQRTYNTSLDLRYDKLPPFINGFSTSSVTRRSPSLLLDKDQALGEIYTPTYSLIYLMEKYFKHKDGKGWELVTMVFSNSLKTIQYFINDIMISEIKFSSLIKSWTHYGAIYQLASNTQTKIIDELIVWNTCLTSTQISSLYLRTSAVPLDEPFLFEKYFSGVGELYGGVYSSVCTEGNKIFTSIKYNTSNNIELRTPLFYASRVFSEDYVVPNTVGMEGTIRCLAGVSATSSTLKKYWLVVDKDRIIISYKLHDPAALRTTPLYQVGYIGKLNSLGNTGSLVFTAGTTTATSYVWTSINTTGFRSGVLYTNNNSIFLGGSYYNAVVGNINTTLTSLKSINNSSFLAGINVSYGASALGSLKGVYALSINQAAVEDLITVNNIDYVVMSDADGGAGVYNLAIKLN